MPAAASQPYGFNELKVVFERLEQLRHPCVLIGGQAVGFWVARYSRLAPVPGLTIAEVEMLSLVDRVGGHEVRVLNPVALIISKAWNVANLDQTDRHDAEQLLVLVTVVRLFLGQLLGAAGADRSRLRGFLKLLERFMAFAERPTARRAARRCGVDWTQCLPLTNIASSPIPAVRRFREIRLPRWRAGLARPECLSPRPGTWRRLLELLAQDAASTPLAPRSSDPQTPRRLKP
ncbi:MAG: hypothetical protein HS113_15495 [Verrucomicrobiales bacterium]|nr:hypothetical protein [Verrucomicrobiales bacterium]